MDCISVKLFKLSNFELYALEMISYNLVTLIHITAMNISATITFIFLWLFYSLSQNALHI